MHTSDHCISVWYKNFTPSSEVLRRIIMMMKIRKSRMSDFSCGETKVQYV